VVVGIALKTLGTDHTWVVYIVLFAVLAVVATASRMLHRGPTGQTQ
jgi:hypothetical protein